MYFFGKTSEYRHFAFAVRKRTPEKNSTIGFLEGIPRQVMGLSSRVPKSGGIVECTVYEVRGVNCLFSNFLVGRVIGLTRIDHILRGDASN